MFCGKIIIFLLIYTFKEPPSLEKRDFVIKELLDTEKNYVDVLSKLKNNYMLPLMNHMKSENHNLVFFKIKVGYYN